MNIPGESFVISGFSRDLSRESSARVPIHEKKLWQGNSPGYPWDSISYSNAKSTNNCCLYYDNDWICVYFDRFY